LPKQKVAQKVTIILGYFILSKNHNEPPKVAHLAKIVQSGHTEQNLKKLQLLIDVIKKESIYKSN
jgi:hypothetical protein